MHLLLLKTINKYGSTGRQTKKRKNEKTNVYNIDSRSLIGEHFTSAEEGWLDSRLGEVDSAMFSISRTEETLREFLMFYLGVPPEIGFLAKTLRVFQVSIL